jgi:2-succinyl-6-hydroxy-2,4-cyclohexadiene-1-carboxylate synthase
MLVRSCEDASVRVVLVPGFTQAATSWRPVTSWAPLADAVELRPVDVPDGLDFVGTAAALGDQGGRAVYVGYSMGGRLCLQLALDRPELVERLVLVSASPGIDRPAERAARRDADDELAAGIERDGVDAFLERWLAQPLFASLPLDLADLDARRANTVERLTHQLRALGQGAQPSNWHRLDQLRMPSLLIVGSRDTKYVAVAERMAGPMRADRCVLEGRGHACHLESGSEFASRLGAWLAA